MISDSINRGIESRDDKLIEGQEENAFEISDSEIYRIKEKSVKESKKSSEFVKRIKRSFESISEKYSNESSEEIVVNQIKEQSKSFSSLEDEDDDGVIQESPEIAKYSNKKKQMKKKNRINYEKILENNHKKVKNRRHMKEEKIKLGDELAKKKSPFKKSNLSSLEKSKNSKNSNSRYKEEVDSEEPSPIKNSEKQEEEILNIAETLKISGEKSNKLKKKEKKLENTPVSERKNKYAKFLKKSIESKQRISLIDRYQKSVEKTKKSWKSIMENKTKASPSGLNKDILRPKVPKPSPAFKKKEGTIFETPKETEVSVNDKTLVKKPVINNNNNSKSPSSESSSIKSKRSSKKSKSTVEEFYVSKNLPENEFSDSNNSSSSSSEKTPEPKRHSIKKHRNPEIFNELEIEPFDIKEKAYGMSKHRKQRSDILYESIGNKREFEKKKTKEKLKKKVVRIKKDIAKERNKLMKKLNDKFIQEMREKMRKV